MLITGKFVMSSSLVAWSLNLSPFGKLSAFPPPRCLGLYAVGGGPQPSQKI